MVYQLVWSNGGVRESYVYEDVNEAFAEADFRNTECGVQHWIVVALNVVKRGEG